MKNQSQKPIRIAHIVGGLTTGGVEAVIYNYFSQIENAPEKYDLVCISYTPPNPETKKRFEDLGFHVYSVTKKKENLIKSCNEVLAIYRKHKINIIHSHMTLMSFIPLFLGVLCGVKVRIAHSHLFYTDRGFIKYARIVCKMLTRASLTSRFACGQDAAEYLFGERAFRKGKVTILKNAILVENFMFSLDQRNLLRERLGIKNKFCVGHVGRFTEQKNHFFLIDVFAKIHKQQPESFLLLVGEGPLENDVRRKVESLGLADAVCFAGSVEEPAPYYQVMDVFLLPSHYEGLGIVAIEAQAASLYTITSENVPREACLTDNMIFLPLDAGAEAWAEQAQQGMGTRSRVPLTNQIVQAGYDIAERAQLLDEFYNTAMRSNADL